MLAEMGVAPKEADAAGTEPAATTGKKKKKKDKSGPKDGEAPVANGNGVAPVQQSTPAEQQQNGEEAPVVIEVSVHILPVLPVLQKV